MEHINLRGGLDEKVNGEGHSRGELYLTLDELRWVQLHVGPEFGFILSPAIPKTQKQKKSKTKSEIEHEDKCLTRSGVSVSNKRQRTGSLSGKSASGSILYIPEDKGNCASSEVSFEGKTTRQSSGNRASMSHDATSRDYIGASNIGPGSTNVAVNMKNIKMIDFKTFSLALLDKLSKIPGSRWFLQPVDPELDGVPDYFDIIENPMDFQTIHEKLIQNMYKNPFGWQLDMRLVFYNALKYHKQGNTVRDDALSLAIEFENKCKEIKEVNPYYYTILQDKQESLPISQLEYADTLLDKLGTFDSNTLIRIYSLLFDSSKESQDFIDDSQPTPEMILDRLRFKPKIIREQIVLLIDSIIQIENKYQKIGQNAKDEEIANKTNFLNDDVAMTPSSDGSSSEDAQLSKDPDIDDEFDGSEEFVRIQTENSNPQHDIPINSDTNSNDDEHEDIYSNSIHGKEILNSSFTSNTFPIPPQESAWGEWKAKVIHNSTLTQRENAPKKSKREREAEQADAEI
ncbi:bromodomain protein [Cryptosporidium ubiquitum]|uniref:Bromodomain protein n=1 Tax=Cryptosporidium ubiquitum TaxID=857276 RepID=A0A1J4MLQ4_9CRYT|nr:bromodomain protein [Cryptosporidium ubiquitum]OII75177.1 bromodomain protein [Cryptosporidium ubiquitum]